MNEQMTARKCSSHIGLALFSIAAITTVLQILFSAIWHILTVKTSTANTEWVVWLLTFAPMYLIAMPIGLAIMRSVPSELRPSAKLGAKRFWTLMLICMPVMYAGNIIGTILSMLLSGGTAENALVNLVSGNPLYTLLIAVIAAPILEEYIFRKQIVDKLSRYGEKTAIVISALTFGLFHMNLFQFFYAFGLGIIFAYVYLRTRSLRYPVAMHMIINFQGSVLAPWILKQLDFTMLDQLSSGKLDISLLAESLPGLMLYMGYSSLIMLASVAGLVLLILNWKKREFQPAEQELPKEEVVRTVFCNFGMIVFSLFCIIMILFTLLSGLL